MNRVSLGPWAIPFNQASEWRQLNQMARQCRGDSMGACEICWEKAASRANADTSKTKTEHYEDLLKENEHKHSVTPAPPPETPSTEGKV